jgi:uncharacterized protein
MLRKVFNGLCIIMVCTAFLFCSAPQKIQDSESSDSTNPKVNAVLQHRKEKHAEFLSQTSPLPPADKKRFKGLNYFPVDTSYHVKGTLNRTSSPVLFKMKTTTSRLPDYNKYGEISFVLKGQEHKLEVYQSIDLLKKPGYEDYLFVPFTDETNGKETYEVGRYLELRFPPGDELVLDFNLCYNPYCSYNPGYSCPIPPEVNHLPIEVRAGEKKYH